MVAETVGVWLDVWVIIWEGQEGRKEGGKDVPILLSLLCGTDLENVRGDSDVEIPSQLDVDEEEVWSDGVPLPPFL